MVAANELISTGENHRKRRDLLRVAVLLLLTGWLIFNWISTAAHVHRYYNPLPVSDYWRVVEDLPAMERGNWGWLWRPHNEHRIIFPELVFAADELWFSGKGVLPLISSFVCYLLTVIILGSLFSRTVEAPAEVKLRSLLLGGIIAGWPLSSFVLGTPFLLQWTLLQFAVVAALWAGSLVAASPGWVPLVAAVTCGVVATFTSANGILLWPVLLCMGALCRASRKRMVALAVSAIATVGLFLVGYHRPSTELLAAAQHPVACLGFVLAYLSMPFGVLRHPAFGGAFGLASLGIWLTCAVSTLRKRAGTVSRYEIVALAFYCYLLLTATATSLGRFETGDLGFSNAKAARYLTSPLLGWALAIPFICVFVPRRAPGRAFPARLVPVITVVIVAFMQIRLGRWLRTNDDYVAHQQWAAVSLANGLFDPATVGSVFPDKAFIQHYLPVLQAGRKSIFSDGASAFLGRDLRLVFPKTSSQMGAGGVLRVTHFEGGVSVLGWADHLGGEGGTTIALVDGSGRIVGLGGHLRAGLPRELLPVPVDEAKTWVGFIDDRYASTFFTPFRIGTDSAPAFAVGPEISVSAGLP